MKQAPGQPAFLLVKSALLVRFSTDPIHVFMPIRMKERSRLAERPHAGQDLLLYFDAGGGGFLTNSTPFSILPLRPLIAASINFFSFSSALLRGLVAFSAPDGWHVVSDENVRKESGKAYS